MLWLAIIATLGLVRTAGAADKVIYSFPGPGPQAYPLGSLIIDSVGALYGTTFGSGTGVAPPTPVPGGAIGSGTVFKLASPAQPGGAWGMTVLHSFSGPQDGTGPRGGVIADSAGRLFGTTMTGGAHDFGTVFMLSPPNWTERILHSFTGGADGKYPMSGVVAGPSGILYGTTQMGGAQDAGVVYRLDVATGAVTTLHTFANAADGRYPTGGLLRESSGVLYGCTSAGGANGAGGTIYQITATGFVTVFSFNGHNGGGCASSLIEDSSGVLYGTTGGGGPQDGGIVFSMKPDIWTLNTLHVFAFGRRCTASAGWCIPAGRLLLLPAHGLYGTTQDNASTGGPGAVFKLAPPSWSLTAVPFTGTPDGAGPESGVIANSAGSILYGTTYRGGANGFGTVFQVRP